MFDVTVQMANLEVATVAPEADPETGEQEQPYALLSMIIGLALPAGPQNHVMIPVGAVRAKMSREAALANAEAMRAAAEELPEEKKPSGLIVANNLSGAEQVSQMDRQFRGGTQG
jgi:hypothetical protein